MKGLEDDYAISNKRRHGRANRGRYRQENLTRGDKLVNEVLNMAEGREPDDNEPKIMMCAGLKETLEN